MSYFSLLSTEGLSRRMVKRAEKLKANMSLIDEMHGNISEQFGQLKKIKPKLGRLAVQVAKLKEEKPRLRDLYEKNEAQVHKIEEGIVSDIEKMLDLIAKSAGLMRDITFDSDIILYREDKRLGRVVKRIKRMRDVDVNKIAFSLNIIKADMKSLTLRLLQATELEEEEVLRYPTKKIKIPPGIRRSGKLVAELEEEKIGIGKIDAVIENSRAKLRNLRAIEMKIILLMSSIDRYHDHLKSRIFLFSKDISAGVGKKIADSIKNFENIKRDVRGQALKLYEDIEIVEKINK